MKRIPLIFMAISMLVLSSCAGGMPQLFWATGDKTPNYGSAGSARNSRPALDVPPELRKEIEVPMAEQIASDPAKGDRIAKATVAGKAVALNTREYPNTPAQIFSATVDAMTALNMPVQSVDSPSGIITSDWIRPDANSVNRYSSAVLGMFGAGPVHLRYRFITRVYRTKNGQSELQIRTLGQQFVSQHWASKQIKKKVYLELFDAVETQLAGQKNIPKVQSPSE